MKPAKLRRNREERQKDAEAEFAWVGNDEPENPFKYGKPKLPCHVPNCNDSSCDRWHPGDDEK